MNRSPRPYPQFGSSTASAFRFATVLLLACRAACSGAAGVALPETDARPPAGLRLPALFVGVALVQPAPVLLEGVEMPLSAALAPAPALPLPLAEAGSDSARATRDARGRSASAAPGKGRGGEHQRRAAWAN